MDTNTPADIVTDNKATEEPSQVWPAKAEETKAEPVATVLDARGMRVNINHCGGCDGSHEDIQVNEYARPQGPFTHWFTCPATADPVSLSLGMLKGGAGLEFSGPVIQELAKAQMAGRYMVIVCYVHAEPDASGKFPLTLTRHGHKFPTGDVYPSKECEGLVGLLMRNLKDEFGDPQPVEMKTVAPHPLKSLLGRVDEAVKQAEPHVPACD